MVVKVWGPTIKYMLKNSKEEKDFEKFVKPVKGALIDMYKFQKEGYMYVKP